MTLEKANEILDGVRAGLLYPTHIVTLALLVTGDIQTTQKEKLWHL